MIHGWTEALVVVHDLEVWRATYTEFARWTVIHEGDVGRDLLTYWQQPAHVAAREIVVAHPEATHGCVRLVEFTGAEQSIIRSNGRAWETGGWFDLNVRVENMAARFAELMNRGWSGASDPVQYQFGPVTVQEWVALGPDGVIWALIQRVDPPLDAAALPGHFGTHFNSTQIVDDIDAARRFYRDVLQFAPAIEVEDQNVTPAPRENVLGIPYEVAAQQPWRISMLTAPGEPGGSVEIIELPGLSGRDFSARANPPNRGIVSLRFPVTDIDALRARLVAHEIDIVHEPTTVHLAPDGDLRLMTARGPCGVRLDFFAA